MFVLLSRASALALALAALGCGGSATPDRPDEPARVLLDSAPGALHAGIYLARSRGYDLAEGVQLSVTARRERTDPRELLQTGRVNLALLEIDELGRLREQGAPIVGVMAIVQDDPQIVMVATEDTLADRKALVQAVIRTLQRGYAEATADPESAITVMVDAVRGLDRATLTAELDDIAPSFSAGARFVGRLDPARLRAWERDARARGELERPLDVGAAFDTTLVGPIPTE